MEINQANTIENQMLIRKPVSEVFEAIVNPEITRNFWFTKSSGRLETGKKVIWEWEMYNLSTEVLVNEIIPNERIVIEWDDPKTTVEFNFKTIEGIGTYVVIRNYGFIQNGDELLSILKDSTGGFTTVLDGMKAFLEFNINLNLIADKFPPGLIKHGE